MPDSGDLTYNQEMLNVEQPNGSITITDDLIETYCEATGHPISKDESGKIEVREGDKIISINKSNVSLDIDFEIKYQNQFIKSQRNKLSIFEDDLTNIYNSRTFCLFEDIEKLKKMGLGKGGSLENALVVKDNSLMNKDGLRNQKEFVNHKILDCMGDLYLSGYKMIGSLTCSQGGHHLTNKLLRKLFSDQKNYSLIEIKGKNLPHSLANRNLLRSIA